MQGCAAFPRRDPRPPLLLNRAENLERMERLWVPPLAWEAGRAEGGSCMHPQPERDSRPFDGFPGVAEGGHPPWAYVGGMQRSAAFCTGRLATTRSYEPFNYESLTSTT